MSEFTKGRWEIYPHVVRASFKVLSTIRVPDSDIANIAYVPVIHGFPEHEAQANVRLIAEAPVMYELLNKAFHILGKNARNDEICREIDECLSRVDGCPSEHEYTPTLTAASFDMYNLLKQVRLWFTGENSAQIFILNDVKALLDSIDRKEKQ